MQQIEANQQIEAVQTLAEKRRESQRLLVKATRYMKVAQRVHDHAAVEYQAALKRYNKLDLLYAEETKLKICKAHKVKRPTDYSDIDRPSRPYNPMPAKLRALLKSLPVETVEEILKTYKKETN